MRASRLAGVTLSPGRTSAQSLLRANSTAGPLLLAFASACGCSMLAEANTSALAPPMISSFRSPDAPYFAWTALPVAASNALAMSVNAPRKLPAA